mgnify:CR=1 FL=1
MNTDFAKEALEYLLVTAYLDDNNEVTFTLEEFRSAFELVGIVPFEGMEEWGGGFDTVIDNKSLHG